MRVVSVNVSLPKTVEWRGRKVTTAIFKEPVEGRVRIRRTGLVGDRQADPSVHGGPTKAVYAYPSEHYPFWRSELGRADLPWGSFGENLTTEGLDERTLRVGDQLRVGSAVLKVTQPRMPCYKLAIRFGRLDMVRRFLASGRSGFYPAVHEEGDVAGGDPIELLGTDHGLPTGSQVVDEVRGEEPGGSSPRSRPALFRSPCSAGCKSGLEVKAFITVLVMERASRWSGEGGPTVGNETANLDVSRVVTLVGTSIAIFTFLLFFLYPRFLSDEIDPVLFQVTLIVIGVAIFSLVYAGLFFYTLTLPYSLNSVESGAIQRKGDLFWLVGYSVLLLEPTLILLTVGLLVVALVWLALWLSYIYLTLHEYRKALRQNVR